MASESIIELQGVTKRFGAKVAVDDVTIAVPRGRCFGWLGPNGSGKTTLIRMMLGLARPTAGSIRVCGKAIPVEQRAALARVGAIVEEPRFYPYLSGKANLEIWAAHYGETATKRIPLVLEQVDLAERAKDKVKTYSLGMRQRLGVARALLNDPELLILDEPTNGLDPAGMVEFRQMIRRLVEAEGRTVFISSHILDEVQRMADDIAIVHAGQLISHGPVDDLLAAGRRVARLRVASAEEARRALRDLIFVQEIRPVDGAACEVVLDRYTDDRLFALSGRLADAGVGLAELQVVQESLEDRFLTLTGGALAHAS